MEQHRRRFGRTCLRSLPVLAVSLTTLTILGLGSGCNQEIPEQINLGDQYSVGNPEPIPRDFQRINAQHKILMAVMDSGIDYNHPELLENVHFDLDQNGQPTRDANGRLNSLGKDVIGLDDCASWRIVDTNAFPFDRRIKETQDDIEKKPGKSAKYNLIAHDKVNYRQCMLDSLTSVSPEAKGIAKYIGPYRSTSFDEDEQNIHGTHVAGLMTYDRPDFGLIAYRILKPYRTKAQIKAENYLETDLFEENFSAALEHAHKRGVKIVNLSLGGSIQAPDETKSTADQRAYEQFQKEMEVSVKKEASIITKYSDMLFVAAAGNDAGRSDDHTRVQFPCGLNAPNLLCVGALKPNGQRVSFTNLPMNNGLQMVYAPGYEIISLKVSDTCPMLTKMINSLLSEDAESAVCKYNPVTDAFDTDTKMTTAFAGLITDYAKLCETNLNHYMRMSGTSMATPLVSHMAAEIWVQHPEITDPQQIIALLPKTFPLTSVGDHDVPPGSLSPSLPHWNHGEPFFRADWDATQSFRADAPAAPKADGAAPGKAPKAKDFGARWEYGRMGHLPLPAALLTAPVSSPGSAPVSANEGSER